MLDTTFYLRHWDGGHGFPEKPVHQQGQGAVPQDSGRIPAKIMDMMGNEVPDRK